MEHLLSSGRLMDLALAVVVIEAIVFVLARHRTGNGLLPEDVLGQLLAGSMLILALRCALTGASYVWTLGFVSASLPAHLYDLARRVRQSQRSGRNATI